MPDGATERAIDRAVNAVKDVFGAELRGIRDQLFAINRRLDSTERLRSTVEQHEVDIKSLQGMNSVHGREIEQLKAANEKRNEEEREDRRDNRGQVIGVLGIIVAIAAIVGNHF